jgi:hypothetical protein
MEYNNPNDAWTQYHDDKEFQDMSEEDMIKAGCWRCLVYIVMAGVAILLSGLIYGCKSVEYVEMPSHHTEHHWHTDSVIKADSVIYEKETIITQLDSTAMAKYGITLKAAERAWIVRTTEMERQIQQLLQMSQHKDSVHDTIPYPVEVVKEVPAELTWWQKTRIIIANVLLTLLAVGGIWLGLSWYLNSRKLLR